MFILRRVIKRKDYVKIRFEFKRIASILAETRENWRTEKISP